MKPTIIQRVNFSLFANFSKVVFTFGTGIMLARGLGPELYGTMMFLLGTLVAVRTLVDMSSSDAFFTFLSQRYRDWRFVGLYFGWLAFQLLFSLLVLWVVTPADWFNVIWRGQERELVALAFFASFMQTALWSTMMQIGESQRLTRLVQGMALLVSVVHFLFILVLWFSEWLTVTVVFFLVSIEWLVASFIVLKFVDFPDIKENVDKPKTVLLEFWRFCMPLIPFAWVGFFYQFGDRWLLQTFGGGVQQAFYAAAAQFGLVVMVATSSILNILWKETAEAFYKKDYKKVDRLFHQTSKGLFFVGAAFAGFLLPWAEKIITLTLGTDYSGGVMTLSVMLIYTAHQPLGQICGTLAYATGQASIYARIGVYSMALSIIVTYFLLADSSQAMPGLGLGSAGLAMKMVVLQIIQVNILAYFLCAELRIKFDWSYQLLSMLACIATGYFVFYCIEGIFGHNSPILVRIIIAGITYAAVLFLVVWRFPSLVGIPPSALRFLRKKLRFNLQKKL